MYSPQGHLCLVRWCLEQDMRYDIPTPGVFSWLPALIEWILSLKLQVPLYYTWASLLAGKKILLQCRRPGFNPWVRKISWRKGYPLQYSGLENSMDCIVHGVAKSWTRLSNFHFQSKSEILSQMMIVKVNSLSCVQLFATPWTVTYQAPLSMGFSRQ